MMPNTQPNMMMPNNNNLNDDTSMTVVSNSDFPTQPRQQRLSGRSTGSNIADGSSYLTNIQTSQMVWENESTYSDSKSSSPHPSFYEAHSGRSSGLSIPRTGLNQLDRTSSRDEGSAGMNQGQQAFYVLQTRIINVPVPTIRFDRIGSLMWTGTNTFLYDFDDLQRTTHHITFYLVDELKLKTFFVNVLTQNRVSEEEFDFNGVFRFCIPEQIVALGLTSIDKVS
jgi:hypothetical protein